jgi:hypothetical protein
MEEFKTSIITLKYNNSSNKIDSNTSKDKEIDRYRTYSNKTNQASGIYLSI